MRTWLVVVPAVLATSVPAVAQQTGVVDEASFTITRGGAPYGTESFKIIRRLGAQGVEYAAQCTRTLEGRVVRTMLSADSTGNLTSYSRATTGSGQSQLTARPAQNRLTVNEDGAQASSRDYVFAPGALILDDDVIHQLYFVTWRGPRSLTFVAPGGHRTGQGNLTEVGREDVAIGRTSVAATRYAFGSGDDRREIWVDSERRLLKVTHPSRQIVGIRDLPPR
jgi:hypothetical protein